MASVAGAPFDLDKPGKYPVVLSDELLGKTSKGVYTGIRYNHKPDPSSSSKTSAELKPSDDPTTYDLSLTDNSEKYEYVGSRSIAEGQYVLIFDPAKKHFVLHRVDSTFDMNLVSTPWTQDADALKTQYPQLEPQSRSKTQGPSIQRKTSTKSGKGAAALKSAPKRQKIEKPKKKPAREPTPEPEDEDTDDGLTVEYPDGQPPRTFGYQSTPIFQRNVSEVSDEDEDAEGEEVEERNQDVDHLKLPSPANNGGGFSDEDLEMDLEAELERALDETHNDAGNNGGESDESEEE